jgi:uncharacterized protein YecT (DUF1311 family)
MNTLNQIRLLIATISMMVSSFSPLSGQPEVSDEEIKVQVANAAIDTVYQQVTSGLSDEQKVALRDSQRAWITWRDAEASFISSFNEVGGSSQKDDYLVAQELLIKRRTEVLKQYLNRNKPDGALVKKADEDNKNLMENASRAIKKKKPVSSMGSLDYMGTWLLEYQGGEARQVSKFINAGKLPIKAFRGKFMLKNDFGESHALIDVIFDSNGRFISNGNISQGHLIMPGDVLYCEIMEFSVLKKEQTWSNGNVILLLVNQDLEKRNQPVIKNEFDLPCLLDSAKLTFDFEKVVNE